jgi:hypothetical protein
MPKYRALRPTFVSHLSVLVEEGQEFEATFPDGMRLGDNLELVEPEAKTKPKAKTDKDESLT